MSKLYTITRSGEHHAQTFGVASRRVWTSPRWIAYHLKRRGGKQFDVHTIDLKAGTVTRCNAAAFLVALPENRESSTQEVQQALGLPVDLATLETLYRSGSFNPELAERVKAYLMSKNIPA